MSRVQVSGELLGRRVAAEWNDGDVTGDVALLALVESRVRDGDLVKLPPWGPILEPGLADPWAFAATVAARLDVPVIDAEGLESPLTLEAGWEQ